MSPTTGRLGPGLARPGERSGGAAERCVCVGVRARMAGRVGVVRNRSCLCSFGRLCRSKGQRFPPRPAICYDCLSVVGADRGRAYAGDRILDRQGDLLTKQQGQRRCASAGRNGGDDDDEDNDYGCRRFGGCL
jgi:hypothetical protein